MDSENLSSLIRLSVSDGQKTRISDRYIIIFGTCHCRVYENFG